MFSTHEAIASIQKIKPISSYLRAPILQLESEALIIHLLDKEETVINILEEGWTPAHKHFNSSSPRQQLLECEQHGPTSKQRLF